MDRRNFVTAAIVGIGASSVARANDFIFPRKSEVKPLLEGLTDEGMAALIGQFPQGEGSVHLPWTSGQSDRGLDKVILRRIEIWEKKDIYDTVISLWTIKGTTIHVVKKTPMFTMGFDGHSVQTGWDIRPHRLNSQKSVDIKSLDRIRLRRADSNSEYRRIETATGAGWFVG